MCLIFIMVFVCILLVLCHTISVNDNTMEDNIWKQNVPFMNVVHVHAIVILSNLASLSAMINMYQVSVHTMMDCQTNADGFLWRFSHAR